MNYGRSRKKFIKKGRKYQKTFTFPSLRERFDTNQCSEERFQNLARNPTKKKYPYDRISIDGYPSGN